MKILKLAYLFLAIFLFNLVAIAQNTTKRNLESFEALKVGQGIHVTITHGNEESVRLEVRGLDLEEVVTEVSGKRLNIFIDSNDRRLQNVDVEAYVTYKNLEHITVNSAARIQTENLLKTDRLKVDFSSAGKGELEIEVDDLEVDLSSAAHLELKGSARIQEIDISSAAELDAFDLVSEEADVSVSSAGYAVVYAKKAIEATASSGGRVRYKGSPEKTYVNSSSGGSIRHSN